MTTVILLAIGVGSVLALPIGWRVARRRFDPFEPIVVFALAWGVMFVVRPIAMAVRDDRIFYGVDIGPTLDEAVLLGLLGAVAFVAAYESRLARRVAGRLPRPRSEELASGTIGVAAVAGVLGLVAFAIFLVTVGGQSALRIFLGGRSEDFDDLLEGAPHYLLWLSLAMVPAALVAWAIAYRTRRARDVGIAVALVALVLARTVPTGGRLYLLMLVGGLVALPYLARRTRPGLRALAVGLAVALVASYTILAFRYSETRDSVTSALSELAASPGRALSPLVEGPDAEMAPALAGALQAIPDRIPHRYGGATFGDLFARPVPRQLWAGKPEPHPLRVTAEVWPVARETGNFNPAYTPLLSFYWDLGLLGVFLGMAAYGLLARVPYELLLRSPASAEVQLVFALAMWTVVIAARYDPVLLVMHCVIMFGPLLAIVRLGSSQIRKTSAETPASASARRSHTLARASRRR